jgi:hypothetical protein
MPHEKCPTQFAVEGRLVKIDQMTRIREDDMLGAGQFSHAAG